VQSANGSQSGTERAALQAEVSQLQQEINRIAETTTFGGRKLLDGSFGTENFQVGANANETIGISLSNARATNVGAHAVDANGTLDAAVAAGATAPANTVASQTLTPVGQPRQQDSDDRRRSNGRLDHDQREFPVGQHRHQRDRTHHGHDVGFHRGHRDVHDRHALG
jgi:flagellin-like hook-associated protein FlgL